MLQSLQIFQQELQQELNNILEYWMRHTPDLENGGFYGSVNNNNQPSGTAPKAVVLHARILWTFSAAYRRSGNKAYLAIAEHAFDYIGRKFNDPEYAGVYWSVDASGKMLDGRKQVYGLAFCIYGSSEYAAATDDKTALDYAIHLYNLIEKYSYDRVNNGYIEAFSRTWQPVDDLRLSTKDANEKIGRAHV